MIWNIACILMSFAINIVMLATWRAPYTLDDIPDPEAIDKLPDEIYE